MDLVDLVIGTAVVVSWLLVLAFVLLFSVRTKGWSRTEAGRTMMALNAVILVVTSLAVLGTLAPDLPGRPVLRLVSWTAVAVVFAFQLRLLLREQAAARWRRRRDNRSAEEETGAHGT